MEEKTEPPSYDASTAPKPAYPVQVGYQAPPPAAQPTGQPMAQPTGQPMAQPTGQPMGQPTGQPMGQPGPPQPMAPVQQGWVQPQQPGAPTVVVQQPVQQFITVNRPLFTEDPMPFQCTNCGKAVTTKTQKKIGGASWVMAGWVCLVCLGFGLCFLGLIPLCIPSLKDTVHTCPECNVTLGEHHHM